MKVAIIADTHINPEDDASTSVYRVHANANRRVLAVIEKINTLGVDLVVHLGDFVHRIQGQPLRAEAIRRFREIISTIRAPLLLVPGNHDEGEKVTPWAPGHPVTAVTLRQYRADFGPDYYSKDHADARFIVLNSQLFGCEDDEEQNQIAFLRAALETPKAKYVFQHHPTRDLLVKNIGKLSNWETNKLCSPHSWINVENGDPAEGVHNILQISEPILLVARE